MENHLGSVDDSFPALFRGESLYDIKNMRLSKRGFALLTFYFI